jgi:hypothetical protein
LRRLHHPSTSTLHNPSHCPPPPGRAQFILVSLIIFTLTLPLLLLAYVPNPALAVVLCVLTVGTYWSVNEVARDVEDPFLYGASHTTQVRMCSAHAGLGTCTRWAHSLLCRHPTTSQPQPTTTSLASRNAEPNDMPLANGQYHMNELLLCLASAERPSSSVSSLRKATRYSYGHHNPASSGGGGGGTNGNSCGGMAHSSGAGMRQLSPSGGGGRPASAAAINQHSFNQARAQQQAAAAAQQQPQQQRQQPSLPQLPTPFQAAAAGGPASAVAAPAGPTASTPPAAAAPVTVAASVAAANSGSTAAAPAAAAAAAGGGRWGSNSSGSGASLPQITKLGPATGHDMV